jgi:hypothetical protein
MGVVEPLVFSEFITQYEYKLRSSMMGVIEPRAS